MSLAKELVIIYLEDSFLNSLNYIKKNIYIEQNKINLNNNNIFFLLNFDYQINHSSEFKVIRLK